MPTALPPARGSLVRRASTVMALKRQATKTAVFLEQDEDEDGGGGGGQEQHTQVRLVEWSQS